MADISAICAAKISGFFDAIDEIEQIGLQAKLPCRYHILRLLLKDDWGTAPAILGDLENMRKQYGVNITADCYPYEYWWHLRVLFPKPITAIWKAQSLLSIKHRPVWLCCISLRTKQNL